MKSRVIHLLCCCSYVCRCSYYYLAFVPCSVTKIKIQENCILSFMGCVDVGCFIVAVIVCCSWNNKKLYMPMGFFANKFHQNIILAQHFYRWLFFLLSNIFSMSIDNSIISFTKSICFCPINCETKYFIGFRAQKTKHRRRNTRKHTVSAQIFIAY